MFSSSWTHLCFWLVGEARHVVEASSTDPGLYRFPVARDAERRPTETITSIGKNALKIVVYIVTEHLWAKYITVCVWGIGLDKTNPLMIFQQN